MKKITFTLAVILGFVARAAAQEEFMPFDFTPRFGGARSVAMGYTFAATNVGVDALNGNPGGLGRISKAQLITSGRIGLVGSLGFGDEYYSDLDYRYESQFGMLPKLTNVSMIFPLELSGFESPLTGAVGYKTFYDISRNIDHIRKGTNASSEIYNTRGLLNHLTLGLGTVVLDKYSIGATYNFPLMSGYKESTESSSSGTMNESEQEWKVQGGGFVSLGAVAHLTPALSAGFAYFGSHEFKLTDGEWKNRNGTSVEKGDYDESIRWEMPSFYSLGVAYQFSPALLLTTDYSSRPWEKVEVDGYDWDNLEDGRLWALGFEFGEKTLFRGGYSNEIIAALDADKDPIKLKGLHLGFGVITDDLLADIAVVYKFSTYDAGTSRTQYEFKFEDVSLYASFIYNFDFVVGKK
jgi:hypothetical protein